MKTILSAILLLFLFASCQQEASPEKGEDEIFKTISKQDSFPGFVPRKKPLTPVLPEKRPCMDYDFLAEKNIQYDRIKEQTWMLSYEKEVTETPRIQSITLRAKHQCPEEFTELFDLFLQLEKDTQRIQPQMYYFHDVDQITNPQIDFIDFNFDGELDFRVFCSATGNGMTLYTYYVYNPKTGQFEYSKALSGTSSLKVDKENKTLHSFGKGGHAGKIYGSTDYHYVNGQLTPYKSERQTYEDSLNAYIRTTTFYEQDNKRIIMDTIRYN